MLGVFTGHETAAATVPGVVILDHVGRQMTRKAVAISTFLDFLGALPTRKPNSGFVRSERTIFAGSFQVVAHWSEREIVIAVTVADQHGIAVFSAALAVLTDQLAACAPFE